MYVYQVNTPGSQSQEVVYQDAKATVLAPVFDVNGLALVNSLISTDSKRNRQVFQSTVSPVYIRRDSGQIETLYPSSDSLTGIAAAVTLVGGQVTVSDTRVTANTVVRLSYQTVGGTPGAVFINARTAGASFVIKSTSGTDTSVIYYEVLAW